MDRAGGLRERKKEETRRAVHAAAVRLTAELGYEQVTVEAIAEAANVSRRTFSNYFSCKEEALLHGEHLYMRSLTQAVLDRPGDEGAWTALRAAARGVYAHWGRPTDRAGWARAKLARKHPALLARLLANHAELARDLERALDGRRLPRGVRPAVLVAVFLACLRVSLETWTGEEAARDLAEIAEEVLDEAEAPFGP
ncbi:TetR/AcrR family transcriptional regulator [Nocardiopsis aegyptia]|uniref:TetR/AcrR family transcriptional regulator n=1 Tax=Nocardiopsis aegyptia TaxID=220378 RepID=UPI00366D4C96